MSLRFWRRGDHSLRFSTLNKVTITITITTSFNAITCGSKELGKGPPIHKEAFHFLGLPLITVILFL